VGLEKVNCGSGRPARRSWSRQRSQAFNCIRNYVVKIGRNDASYDTLRISTSDSHALNCFSLLQTHSHLVFHRFISLVDRHDLCCSVWRPTDTLKSVWQNSHYLVTDCFQVDLGSLPTPLAVPLCLLGQQWRFSLRNQPTSLQSLDPQ